MTIDLFKAPPLVRCLKCGHETVLITKEVSKFLDVAWGIPKWFPNYIQVTECCGVEDFEEKEEVM